MSTVTPAFIKYNKVNLPTPESMAAIMKTHFIVLPEDFDLQNMKLKDIGALSLDMCMRMANIIQSYPQRYPAKYWQQVIQEIYKLQKTLK